MEAGLHSARVDTGMERDHSILAPPLLVVWRRKGLFVLLSLLVIAPLSGRLLSLKLGHEVPAFFNGPIGIGCLLALTRERLHNSPPYRRWVHSQAGLLLPLIILLCSMEVLHSGGLRDALSSLVANISVALWLDWVVINARSLPGRFLNHAVAVYIGVLSYSIYLWQQPFVGKSDALILSGNWTLLRNPVAQLAALAICALVSYYLVERPMLRWRTKLETKWFPNKKQTQFFAHQASEIRKVEG